MGLLITLALAALATSVLSTVLGMGGGALLLAGSKVLIVDGLLPLLA